MTESTTDEGPFTEFTFSHSVMSISVVVASVSELSVSLEGAAEVDTD